MTRKENPTNPTNVVKSPDPAVASATRERAYAAIVQSTDAAIITLDLQSLITEWNPAAERLYGFSASEAIGQSVDLIVPEELRAEERELLERVRNGTSVERMETRRRTKSGGVVYVSLTASPLHSHDGEVVGVSKIAQDVTPRRVAERRFQQLFDVCPSGLCVVGTDGRIQIVNGAFCAVFGYTQTELIGKSVELLIPSRLRGLHHELRADYARSPHPRAMGDRRDLLGLRKDGTEIAVEIGLSPLEVSEGAVLVSLVDVTERKMAHAKLAESARQLKRINAELEKFAYVVSHDIKAPLRGIGTVAEWIRTDFGPIVDPDSRENLNLMLERVHRLDRLIDGILQYSRAGRSSETRVLVDTNALVLDVIASLSPPEHISVEVAGELPRVEYNETELRQVFQNLVDNALRHLGKPNGVISVSGRRVGDYIEFSVRDTGVGIPERHFERIFELFQTLKPKDESGTTGAGLAIVKRIVECNGGLIRVTSQLDAGSEFTFSVPTMPTTFRTGSEPT